MNSAIETIERSMGPAMLVTMRIGGLAIYAPVLSTTSVPMRLKVLLVFVAGIGAFMLLSAKGVPMPEVAMNPWSIVPLAAVEIGIGAFIGFLATMPMLAMQTAGMINGQQMGLGFARFYRFPLIPIHLFYLLFERPTRKLVGNSLDTHPTCPPARPARPPGRTHGPTGPKWAMELSREVTSNCVK